MLVRAYQNGKGFLEADRMYREDYSRALDQCNYLHNIKEVNKIFYRNYSSMSKAPLTVTEALLKIVLIPTVLFLCLSAILPFASFPYQEFVVIGLLGLILTVLSFVSFKTFYERPSHNNQIEQSIADVEEYFEQINREMMERGLNIEWSCAKDFMYL